MAVAQYGGWDGGVRKWTSLRLFRLALRLGGGAILLGAGAALLMGALAPFKYNYDAFAHLRLQFALAALGGSALLALGGGWRTAFFGAFVGALGIAGLGPALGEPLAAPAECVAARLTVAAANVHDKNPDFDRLVDALLAADADVLSTEESVSRFWSASKRLQSRYPYRLTHIPKGGRTRSVMLWSKLPLTLLQINGQKPDATGLALAEVSLDGRRVAIAGLHASRPVIGPQREQFVGLAPFFRNAPAPRVVMGDFNATPWSHGLSVAQESVGARVVPGFRLTWHGRYPNPVYRRRGWKPPAIIGNQIDHVLISQHFAVESIDTFDLPGSVHSGVKATLQLKKAGAGCDRVPRSS